MTHERNENLPSSLCQSYILPRVGQLTRTKNTRSDWLKFMDDIFDHSLPVNIKFCFE